MAARSLRSIARAPHRARVLLAVTGLILAATPLIVAAPPAAASRAASATTGSHGGPISYFFVSNLHSNPFWITPGPDGNLWFTDKAASLIGRITPDGVITEFDIGTGKAPYAIVAGADGNLWFTEQANDKVGAVDVNGNLVHEYYAPGVDSVPTGITAGPDGAIWFTEMGSGTDITDAVGRIGLDGSVHVYQLYPCACFPIGITTGPDGNIWAAEEEGVAGGASPGTIDSISPAGRSIARYAIPVEPNQPGHLPANVAPGPDGNVWFTEYASDLHQIGKVTPSGQITEYPLPGSLTNSVAITTGADGRLWVTQGDANDVVVVEPSGTVVTTYATHQEPAGITIGPDGNMWFAAALDGEIGRIHTSVKGYAYVLDIAPGFTPAARTVKLGTTVEWVLEAPGTHRVQDATGLSQYDSGASSPVSFETYAFTAAGTYPYQDSFAGSGGSVAVPVIVPASGQIGTPFPVTWASAVPAAGLVFDVQVKVPGSAKWRLWQSAVTSTTADYTPTGAGEYAFRGRLRGPASTAASQWSPAVIVTVS